MGYKVVLKGRLKARVSLSLHLLCYIKMGFKHRLRKPNSTGGHVIKRDSALLGPLTLVECF